MTFSITTTLIFFMFCIFWIQIPGLLICKYLMPRRFKFSTRLLASFFVGFFVISLLYYFESLFKVKGLIAVAGPVLSVLAILVYLKKGRPSVFNAGEHFRWLYVILFAIIYITSMLNFQLRYLFAFSGQTTAVYHDYLFHTGNIVSLSRSFPAMDIRIDGLTFYYHYFYELIFGMCKHIFQMDAFTLYLNGNALICAFPLTMALITIGDRIRAGKNVTDFKYFTYCGGLLVSMICLFPINVVGAQLPFSWMDNHFFGNANAMGLAMSLTILCIDVLAEIWYDKLSIRNLIIVYILTAVTTGFKGTSGALIVGITWAVFIIESLITKHFHLQQFLYNVAQTVAFVCTYLFITVGFNPSGSNNRAMAISIEGTVGGSRAGQILTKLGLDYMALPWAIIGVMMVIVCIIGPCIIVLVPFMADKFKILIEDGIIGNIFDWFAIGSILMGLIGYCAVTVPGNSQVYFVITNAGLIYYCVSKYILLHRGELISKIMHYIFVLGAVLLVVDLAYYCKTDIKQYAINQSPADGRADLVSAETMDAYFWLRDNTPEDAIIAVDRFSEELDYRDIYFYASAFSERQCFLEGHDYSDITDKQVEALRSINEQFYSDNPREAEAAMDVSGVSYLVVTDQEHPYYFATSRRLKRVFNNDEVTIYEFNSQENYLSIN